jgi:hypothetical protein
VTCCNWYIRVREGICLVVENLHVSHTPVSEEHHKERRILHKTECCSIQFIVVYRWFLIEIGYE